MAILDKAPELVRAYASTMVDDGYGTLTPTPDYDDFTEFKGFVLPVGFSGAGWAINSKLAAQGFADIARDRILCKPDPSLEFIDRWTQLDVRGIRWTVQEQPRLLVGSRPTQTLLMITIEMQGKL